MDKYLVMLDKAWVRDSQFCRAETLDETYDYDSDCWEDIECDLVMGTVWADSACEAIDIVAKVEGINREAFSAVQVPTDFEVGVGYDNSLGSDNEG